MGFEEERFLEERFVEERLEFVDERLEFVDERLECEGARDFDDKLDFFEGILGERLGIGE